MATLYVGNLAHETVESELRAAFSRYGEVVKTKIVSDRRGRPRGFGYVEMGDEASAMAAMESLRGTHLNGRTMDIVRDEPSRRRGGAGRAGGRRRR